MSQLLKELLEERRLLEIDIANVEKQINDEYDRINEEIRIEQFGENVCNFKKGDGLPDGIFCTPNQRTEIINLLRNKGYYCLTSNIEWMPIVFNGNLWVICTNDAITNKFDYETLKEKLK